MCLISSGRAYKDAAVFWSPLWQYLVPVASTVFVRMAKAVSRGALGEGRRCAM